MELDKTLTPEEHWENIKREMFKGNVPGKIESIVKEGLETLETDNEKWMMLSSLLLMAKDKFGK